MVKDRVLTTLTLQNVHINDYRAWQSASVEATMPVFSKLDLWIELKFSQGRYNFTADNDITAPIFFTSPVFAQIDSSAHSSIVYSLPQTSRMAISYPVSDLDYYQGGLGLVANIYGKDSVNTTYLLFSSAWSGGGWGFTGSTSPALSNSYSAVAGGSLNGMRLDFVFQ